MEDCKKIAGGGVRSSNQVQQVVQIKFPPYSNQVQNDVQIVFRSVSIVTEFVVWLVSATQKSRLHYVGSVHKPPKIEIIK
jgi:hypothetical protein